MHVAASNPALSPVSLDSATAPKTEIRSVPFELLQSAVSALLEVPRLAQVLSRSLDFAARIIPADAYAIWRSNAEGSHWFTLASKGLSREYVCSVDAPPQQRVIPGPIVAHNARTNPYLQSRAHVYEQEGIESLAVFPLLFGGTPHGTLCCYFRHPHTFTPEEVQSGEVLARIVGTAIATAELYEEQLAQRRRLELLASAGVVLASSLDFESTLQRVAQLAVPAIADWCSVLTYFEGKLEHVAVAHQDPNKIALAERLHKLYPEKIRPGSPTDRMLTTGQSELVPIITDEILAAVAQDKQHLEILRELGIRSGLGVPIKSRGQVIGILRLVTAESGRILNEEDLRLAEDLAVRAGVAIENARLYRALKKERAALHQTVQQLQLIEGAVNAGTWHWDVASGISYWPPGISALWGLPAQPHEISFDEFQQRIHPEDREHVVTTVERSLAAFGTYDVTFRVIWPDSSVHWLSARGATIKDESGKPTKVVGIAVEATDRVKTEEALRQSEKLAATGRLAATIAHEINNPLEAVTNLLYLCSTDPGMPDHLRSYMQQADEELARVTHIAQQTRGFYRESATYTRLDLGLVVQQVLDLYRKRIASKETQLRCEFQAGALVHGSKGELRQVASNLILNALDAIPMRGTIKVAVRRSVKGTIRLFVADNGAGIESSNRKNLFQPFFSTKQAVGTGLGLWVSKGIVEKHGGRISLRSRCSGSTSGTVFVVELPAQ